MQNLGNINKTRAQRPYWLLLALILFFAGQVATAGHWHDDANKVDADCALCVLSNAAGAAITVDALIFASVAFCLFVLIETTRAFVTQCVCVYNSRAPPAYY